MVAVIDCESQFVHYKQDGTVLQGRVDPRDTGVGQINKGFHPEVHSTDLWKNLAYVRKLYDRNGFADYQASRGCWDHLGMR